MKRKVLVTLASLIAVSVAVGIGQAKPVEPPIKVGVLLNGSGPLWYTAAFEKAGAELAVADQSKINPVSLSCADIGDTDIEANQAMQKMAKDDVSALVAPLDSESSKKVAKLNLSDPIPLLAPSALDEGIATSVLGRNYFFRLASTTTQDAAALADYLKDQNLKEVVIVTDSDTYSKTVSRMLNFSLFLRDVRVSQFGITEYEKVRRTSPDAFVLVSLETSVPFLQNMQTWVKSVGQGFLVSGNLANYSMYSWGKNLQGFRALIPSVTVPLSFKKRLATYMDRPSLLNSPNTAVFALAKQAYDAVRLIANSQADRYLISQAQILGKPLFTPDGYFKQQNYTVYEYQGTGMYVPVGSYQPNSP